MSLEEEINESYVRVSSGNKRKARDKENFGADRQLRKRRKIESDSQKQQSIKKEQGRRSLRLIQQADEIKKYPEESKVNIKGNHKKEENKQSKRKEESSSCPPVPQKVAKILSWRWKNDRVKKSLRKSVQTVMEREYFVKWYNQNYWRCGWISEMEMKVSYNMMYHLYASKNDMENPPVFDDQPEDQNNNHKGNSVDVKLKQKYYKYGVKPEWLIVHRVINHRTSSDGQTSYLVKWRDLPYDQATWEEEEESIPDFKSAIEHYLSHRSYNLEGVRKMNKKESRINDEISDHSGQKHFIPPPEHPLTDLTIKWDKQPDYFNDLGMQLHPYQIEGLNWLRQSWANGTNTILADEMGLGKTIQTAAFLYSLNMEGHCKGPFLVCVPLSTLINWEREFEIWAPQLYVVSYFGDKDSRSTIRENELTFDEDGAPRSGSAPSKLRTSNVKFNVLITSFELISIDSACLSSIDWSVLVVDEAHRLKSINSLLFKTFANYNIKYKLLLTGTPLQNNLEELYHLLHFLCDDKFNDLTAFKSEFSKISKADQVKKIHEILSPHMLRRLKTDVLKSMPTKSEFVVRVELSPMQQEYYKYALTRNYEALNSKSASGNPCSILNVMMNLKKCCNHPYMFPSASVNAPQKAGGMYEFRALTNASGKLIVLEKMLKILKRQGHRVLIFSQMTRMLDILEDFLHGAGYEYERIDGGITRNLRQEAIDRFNAPDSDSFVFLLSTRAGGLGINLATADTVIIYDSDWNPHNDIQALSRAHRIGQSKKVKIYRFMTVNSIEEKVTEVANEKMMLTNLVRPAVNGEATELDKQGQNDISHFDVEELLKEE